MTDITDTAQKNIERLLAIMAHLRDPATGCPWDVEQTFTSIAPHTIEEAYEVADAIHRGDMKDLKEELGDLLLQVVFHAQMAEEAKLFDFDDVARTVSDKLVRRHPHVFGDASAATAADVVTIWDARKDAEKARNSAIDGVTLGLPALLRAQKLQKKAAKAGFVWPDHLAAWAKVEEEILELKSATTVENEAEEMGDLLFCLVNYARMKGQDCEELLANANKKFERRFKAMEKTIAASGRTLNETTLQNMLAAWSSVKDSEKTS